MSDLAQAQAEIAVLRDLLETAYRKTDEARLESEKADDEAQHLKAETMRMTARDFKIGYATVKHWQARAEAAEKDRDRLREALEPFASVQIGERRADEENVWHSLKVRDFRRARALAKEAGGQ